MEYLMMAALGLVAGLLAKFLVPGRDPGGLLVTILIGIAGSFVGGFVVAQLNIGDMGLGAVAGIDIFQVLTATGGAIILLILYRLIFGRGRK